MTIKGWSSDSRRDSQSSWFQHLSPAKVPLLRIFCFPYAGGGADVYRSWQSWFPEELDLCLVHLPGRGRRLGEPAFTRVLPMVEAVADRIEPETGIPYLLYGHSMGALLCFELARELYRRGQSGPQHLLISGRRAPQLPPNEPPTFNLPRDEFISRLKRLNGTPREVLEHPELMELFLDLLRADFEAVESYEYRSGEPLSCPITVYGGLQDEHVPVESCYAWKMQTTTSCEVRMFTGDHFFIRNPGSEFINAFRSDAVSALPEARRRETGPRGMPTI